MRARAGAHDAYILNCKITVFIANGQIKPRKPSLEDSNDRGLQKKVYFCSSEKTILYL
jgi:hypothetical protein